MRRGNRQVDALLLVGGFSENPYLFKRVFERFRHQIPVIARPDDADTATNRGAARVSQVIVFMSEASLLSPCRSMGWLLSRLYRALSPQERT